MIWIPVGATTAMSACQPVQMEYGGIIRELHCAKALSESGTRSGFGVLLSGRKTATIICEPLPLVTISGTTGIDGVVMNGLPGNPVTTGGGLYSVQVPYSWSGTVTPAKPNYVFSPSQRIYSDLTTEQLDQDYTGQNIFDLSNDSELGYNDIAL
jgi:hypothetical protein